MWQLMYLNIVLRRHVHRHWLKDGQNYRFHCKLQWPQMRSGLLKATSGNVNHICEIRSEKFFDKMIGHFCFYPPWPLKSALYASPYDSKIFFVTLMNCKGRYWKIYIYIIEAFAF